MRVLLKAPLLTNSGYGVHSRQVFELLNERNDIDLVVECLNWGQTPWLINENLEDGLVGKIMLKSKKIEGNFDLSIQVQLPDEWDHNAATKNIGISAFVETNMCNPKWITACNKMDMVIVPSEFTKKVAVESGLLTTDIHVIPEWFNHHVIKENKNDNLILTDERLKFSKKFNFLIISQLTAMSPTDDRKNIYNAIKWTLEEFQNDPDVGLVLKTNLGRGSKKDKKNCVNLLKQMIDTFNVKNKTGKINLIHGNLTSQEIACLYKHENIKGILNPTRGEGYGLPLVDAAAAAMPVVATDKTGHLDFLTIEGKKHFLPVDYQNIKISESRIDNRIFFENFSWCDPSELSFKKQIRSLYEDYEKHKKTAETLSLHVKENFCKDNIKKIYNQIIFGEK